MSEESTFKHLEIPFDEKINYLLPGEKGNLLLVQTISQNNEEQCFYLVDLSKMETIRQFTASKDFTNLVVKSFSKERFVVVSFSEQQNPDLMNVYVFKWDNAEPVLAFQNTKVINSSSDYVEIIHPMIQGKTVQLDLSLGTETKSATFQPVNFESTKYPTGYTDGSKYFEWFEKILKNLGFTPQKQCEYLKLKELLLVSFYIVEDELLANYLAVLDTTGNLLESFLLASNLKGIGKDTFFVIENRAIFVTNNNTLHVLEI